MRLLGSARTIVAVSLLTLLGACGEEVQLADGGGMDGAVDRADGAAAGDGAVSADGGALDGSSSDGSISDGAVAMDGSAPSPVMCQSHLYECGNGLDDDGDGLADDRDPDCLGPCDNNEAGFYLNIPGGDSAPCRLDCYFDQDEGSGNDGCNWDHRCDPLEPDENPACMYSDPPPASARCPEVQRDMCETVCAPLVPNGCDCFGCCNLPAGGDRWVFIGSVDPDGTPSCSLDRMSDDEACHPCTPVANCLNPCGPCELCLGRTSLPPECLPPAPDAGVPADAGPTPDGGFPDAGTPPPPTCDDGRQACGVPGLPTCPAGAFCLTGCCTFFG